MQEQITVMEPARLGVGDLLGIGMTIVVLVIGLAFGLQITGEVRDDVGVSSCADRTDGFIRYSPTTHTCMNASDHNRTVTSAEFNGTVSGIEAVAKIPAKLGTIVTVVVAAILISLLVRYLWVRNSEG